MPPARIIPALAGNTPDGSGSPLSYRDHPRSRGEYATRGWQPVQFGGSSPLSRGIRPHCFLQGRGRGIIPALAGNTPLSSLSVWVRGDHPRSRGEYGVPYSRASWTAGSSPLSRGILAVDDASEVSRRIIPALAGNTHVSLPASLTRSDHPRSRGEYRCWICRSHC